MTTVKQQLGSRFATIRAFIADVYGRDLHAKRVASLAGATLGVMTGASLAVATIGQALAQARGLITKHAIKQVDRLPSNQGIDVVESFAHGFRTLSAIGATSWWRWTGPNSTATDNRRWHSIW